MRAKIRSRIAGIAIAATALVGAVAVPAEAVVRCSATYTNLNGLEGVGIDCSGSGSARHIRVTLPCGRWPDPTTTGWYSPGNHFWRVSCFTDLPGDPYITYLD